MMKKFLLSAIFISLLGFSQEKITTQDFGLNPKTETVISKQTWVNGDYNKGVYIETLTFHNTFLQSKKNQDGNYITEDKYFYNSYNQLIKKETLHQNSGQTEAVKFYYQNGKLSSKEFYVEGKLITKTAFTYKNGRLVNEIEKTPKNELVYVVDYSGYVNDDTYIKSSIHYKGNEILEKKVQNIINGLVITEEDETEDLKLNTKYIYSINRRLVKEIVNNNEMNVYSYKFDENGNPVKIYKINNQDKGDSIILIQNTYSDFSN